MIFLLLGTDRLAIDERLRSLRLEHDPSGINTTIFDQAAAQLGGLRSAALAPGFFGTARVVVARDLFAEPVRAGSSGRARASERSAVLALLAEIPDSTVLIVAQSAASPVELREIRDQVSSIRVETFEVPRGRELIDWVHDRAKLYEVSIESDAAVRLVEALFPAGWRAVARRDDVPPDLFRLDREIAKLSSAASDGVITAAVVDDLVAGVESSNIWGLTDAIAAGDAAAAIREAERAVATGTAPEVLIGQLAAQYETFAALAAGESAGVSTVAAETGITEARLQQATRAARRFPISRVRRGLAQLRDVDVGSKRGEIDAEDLLLGIVAQLAADR
ncbi:MAG TPA: hypothetical protein VMU89_20920 [Thermomicrobiaceae bacterium]|nr:hypothetical protein [Thermomicrobiaceae bacterium]